MSKKFTRIVSGLAMCSIVISGVGIAGNITAKADTATLANYETIDTTNYKNGKTPKSRIDAHKDWVFAGWYSGTDNNSYVKSNDTLNGEMNAKFISDKVLSVMCQNKTDAQSTDTTSVRLVTTVDNLYYQNVGFEVKINGNTRDIPINTVYESITSVTDGVNFSHAPTIFDTTSKYFATVTLTGIPKTGYATGIYVKPYVITMDGSKVYGVGRYLRIEDQWNSVVNIPVRLSTEEQVAAGKIDVSYDADNFKYLGGEDGDLGELFTEMYVHDNGEGKITCVGNTSPIVDADADGMMVSLRFKKLNAVTESAFNVTNEDFANLAQQKVTIDASNVTYKTVK